MSDTVLPHIFVLLFWINIFFGIYFFLKVRDWWLYHPAPRRFRCQLLGHDYHNGAARNLPVLVNDQRYLFDFCQRCSSEQNRRLEPPDVMAGHVLESHGETIDGQEVRVIDKFNLSSVSILPPNRKSKGQ